jgi:hypothetical protein
MTPLPVPGTTGSRRRALDEPAESRRCPGGTVNRGGRVRRPADRVPGRHGGAHDTPPGTGDNWMIHDMRGGARSGRAAYKSSSY